MTKLVLAFVAGVLTCMVFCWAYIKSARNTIKMHETYMKERIDKGLPRIDK